MHLKLTVFWQDFFKLVVVRAEPSHVLHVDYLLKGRIPKPAHTTNVGA